MIRLEISQNNYLQRTHLNKQRLKLDTMSFNLAYLAIK